MKHFASIAILLLFSVTAAFAQEEKPKQKLKIQFKPYGFIRNFYAFDTRESNAMTEDFYYYVPKDWDLNDRGEDLNENPNFKFAAITSRLGLDITGFSLGKWDFAAKIEADFYAGLSKTDKDPVTKSSMTGTAQLRLRQAFVSVGNGTFLFKAGQAWHPMAVDLPHVFALNSGAPFGPFSRTPQISAEWNVYKTGLSLTAATLWQMQYTSSGPYGASANYIRNGGCEFYAGLNFKKDGFLGRAGVDVLHITPRVIDEEKHKVHEGITTWSPYVYLQYTSGIFQIKAKTIFAQAGEHMNLNGGYAIHQVNEDGSWSYTPTRTSSTWASIQLAPGKWQLYVFGGYVQNLGTMESVTDNPLKTDADKIFYQKNSFAHLNAMWRVTPGIVYNIGKRLAIGVEYELTSVKYGDAHLGMNLATGLYDKGLHDVVNHRVLGLIKFTF